MIEQAPQSVIKRLLQTKPGVVAANLALAVVYGLLGTLALQVTRGTGLASPIWPSAGLAFALVYQYGPRLLPGIVVGSFANNAYALAGMHANLTTLVTVAGSIALGAAIQAQVARSLVQRFVGRHVSLVSSRQILSFLLLSGPAACLINATVGVVVQRAFDIVPHEMTWRVLVTWWIGDTLGVIIFGPITLMMLPDQAEVWRDRRLKIALPALASVIVSVALFLQGAAMAQQQQDTTLQNTADTAQSILSHELSRDEEVLAGIRGLFVASQYVSQVEFRDFTDDPLTTHPALFALSWDPLLTGDGMSAFVRHQRADELIDSYTVTEQSPSGALVPVHARSQYVVVGYIEPIATTAQALGYDIASSPLQLDALNRAVATGKVSATAPLALVEEPERRWGFLLLLPIYNSVNVPASATDRAMALRGFAVAVFRASDLIRVAFPAARWHDQTLVLSDVTDAGQPVVMAEVTSLHTGTPLPTLSRTLRIAGRTWRLDISTTIRAGAQPQLVTEPAVMFVGLTIALLLMSFLLLISGLERQARREAETDPLTGLFNRRALLARLESARRVSQSVGTSHVLLFLDLDRFKAVNDNGGHAAGDALLQDLALILRRAVRETDTVARVGGDEFAIILLDCNASRGWSIAEEIVHGVRDHSVMAGERRMTVGVSVGLAMISAPDPENADQLLRQADRASYVAKFAGGNRVVQHKPDEAFRN